MKRFALMAVLGAMLCGSLIAGCGGSSDEDTSATGGKAVGGNAVGGNAVGKPLPLPPELTAP